ncbi:hypothetical protein ACIBJF_51395 [Streptomyces sp. NPDC050743]|uniref:hypothetical protein n=1 Tax=Streptomyces sp. NPDC050743 TaxID=3365634 RepID=UPI0037A2E0AB
MIDMRASSGTRGDAGRHEDVRERVPDQSGGPVGHSARFGVKGLERIQAGLHQAVRAQGRMRQLLDAVLTVSSALDLNVVLHAIADTARQLVQARYAAVGVLDEEGDFAELITSGSERISAGWLGVCCRMVSARSVTWCVTRARCAWTTWPAIPTRSASLRAIRS